MKLKVYGWQSFREDLPAHHKQSREICAAPSMAAAARASGHKRPDQMFNICTTGNAQEIEIATREPGVVFYRDLNDYSGSPRCWRKASR